MDILNVRNTITRSVEVADLGAWRAYALPQSKEDYGSFIGTLVMGIAVFGNKDAAARS